MLYILKQEKESRFKIGISRVPKDRIIKLEKEWGKFDSDSLFYDVPDSIRMEKSLHYVFESNNLKDLPKKDGYTEFFNISCIDQVVSILKSEGSASYEIGEFLKVEEKVTKKVTLSNHDSIVDRDYVFVKSLDFKESFKLENIQLIYPEEDHNGYEGGYIIHMSGLSKAMCTHHKLDGMFFLICHHSTWLEDSNTCKSVKFSLGIDFQKNYNRKQQSAIIDDIFDSTKEEILFSSDGSYRESERDLLYSDVIIWREYNPLNCVMNCHRKFLDGKATYSDVVKVIELCNNTKLSEMDRHDVLYKFGYNSIGLDKDLEINGIRVFKSIKTIGDYKQVLLTEEFKDHFEEVIEYSENGNLPMFSAQDMITTYSEDMFKTIVCASIGCTHTQLEENKLDFPYMYEYHRLNDFQRYNLLHGAYFMNWSDRMDMGVWIRNFLRWICLDDGLVTVYPKEGYSRLYKDDDGFKHHVFNQITSEMSDFIYDSDLDFELDDEIKSMWKFNRDQLLKKLLKNKED